jgi:hypothetical protein
MTPLKKWLLIGLVTLAFVMTGLGGLEDMFGIRVLNVTPQHAWNDGHFMLLLAILVALTLP